MRSGCCGTGCWFPTRCRRCRRRSGRRRLGSLRQPITKLVLELLGSPKRNLRGLQCLIGRDAAGSLDIRGRNVELLAVDLDARVGRRLAGRSRRRRGGSISTPALGAWACCCVISVRCALIRLDSGLSDAGAKVCEGRIVALGQALLTHALGDRVAVLITPETRALGSGSAIIGRCGRAFGSGCNSCVVRRLTLWNANAWLHALIGARRRSASGGGGCTCLRSHSVNSSELE